MNNPHDLYTNDKPLTKSALQVYISIISSHVHGHDPSPSEIEKALNVDSSLWFYFPPITKKTIQNMFKELRDGGFIELNKTEQHKPGKPEYLAKPLISQTLLMEYIGEYVPNASKGDREDQIRASILARLFCHRIEDTREVLKTLDKKTQKKVKKALVFYGFREDELGKVEFSKYRFRDNYDEELKFIILCQTEGEFPSAVLNTTGIRFEVFKFTSDRALKRYMRESSEYYYRKAGSKPKLPSDLPPYVRYLKQVKEEERNPTPKYIPYENVADEYILNEYNALREFYSRFPQEFMKKCVLKEHANKSFVSMIPNVLAVEKIIDEEEMKLKKQMEAKLKIK